ncbi:MAG: hypothetical protein DDT32_02288 [Syntrophomonadaceae bacterium]|nr:hypothetical protein [Bacillota bacterium]
MSRLSDYLAWLDEVGGDKARWEAALRDTKACQAEALREATPIGRLRAFYKCRKGKRLAVKGT